MKPRIHQNVWGNWNGYLGNRRVIEFGTSAFDAREWLTRIQALPAAEREANIREHREYTWIVRRPKEAQ